MSNEPFFADVDMLYKTNAQLGDCERYDSALIERYASVQADVFPPIVLNNGMIRDGMHRTCAARRRGDKTIRAINEARPQRPNTLVVEWTCDWVGYKTRRFMKNQDFGTDVPTSDDVSMPILLATQRPTINAQIGQNVLQTSRRIKRQIKTANPYTGSS